jgi:hypothetical protein
MKRRLLPVVVLLSCAILAGVVLYGDFLAAARTARPGGPGLPESDPESVSQELDQRLQSTEAHRELLQRLSADLIAGRGTLPDAATVLADFTRQHKPEWLRRAGRHYPGRSEQASVAASLVYYTQFRLRDGNPDEETARRLAASYRACSGVPLTLPEPAKGAAIPPCWRVVGAGSAGRQGEAKEFFVDADLPALEHVWRGRRRVGPNHPLPQTGRAIGGPARQRCPAARAGC